MNLGPLRALVFDLNISAHGLPVTVTPVGEVAIVTRGIWLTPSTEDVPGGMEFHRRDARRVMALSRATVATLPNGSLVRAPEQPGGADKTWRVDGIDRVEADHQRVVLVLESDA